MKLKMKTTACGPNGNLERDKTYDLPEAQALPLIAGGYAESAEPPLKAPNPSTGTERTEEKIGPVETAEIPPREAALSRRGRRPRG